MPRFRSLVAAALLPVLGLGLIGPVALADECDNLALICIVVGDNTISILAPGVLIGASKAGADQHPVPAPSSF